MIGGDRKLVAVLVDEPIKSFYGCSELKENLGVQADKGARFLGQTKADRGGFRSHKLSEMLQN